MAGDEGLTFLWFICCVVLCCALQSDEVQHMEVFRQETLHFSLGEGLGGSGGFTDASEASFGDSFSRSMHNLTNSLRMDEIDKDLFFKND